MQKDSRLLISDDIKWTHRIKAAFAEVSNVLSVLKRSSLLTLPVNWNHFNSMIIHVPIRGSTCWCANDSLKALESF